MRRRGWSAAVALGLSLGFGGCKRKETLAPVDLGALADDLELDAEAALAPAWRRPAVALLDEQLLVVGLHEPGTSALFVRLAIPLGSKLEPEHALVGVLALQLELAARLDGVARVEVEWARPGRVELVLASELEELPVVVGGLASALGERVALDRFEAAQGRALRQVQAGDPSRPALEHALARVLPGLVTKSPSPEAIAGLSRSALERAWPTLFDPRSCVLMLHAGQPLDALAEPLADLAARWRGAGLFSALRPVSQRPLARLRPDRKAARLGRDDPRQSLAVVAGPRPSAPTIWLVRALELPTPRERALARLAQRLLQEELDARLVIGGGVGALAVRIPLAGGSARTGIAEPKATLTRLDEFWDRPLRSDRLVVAARLWLGARVVAASLDGEDWTGLWSASLDLATDDAAVTRALATDARELLSIEPEALKTWAAEHLRPFRGQRGWAWALTGADPALLERLGAEFALEAAP